MTIVEDPAEPASSHEVCAVCGAAAKTGDIEDTSGWRWFSDGQGGLFPLCPTCPVPERFRQPRRESEGKTPSRSEVPRPPER
jgi:hypothetical protein